MTSFSYHFPIIQTKSRDQYTFPRLSATFFLFLQISISVKTNVKMKGNNIKRPIQVLQQWLRRQPPKIKTLLAFVSAVSALIVIRMVVYDHDNLFIAAEAVHALGISVLIYKLATEKTCAGNLWYYHFVVFVFNQKVTRLHEDPKGPDPVYTTYNKLVQWRRQRATWC